MASQAFPPRPPFPGQQKPALKPAPLANHRASSQQRRTGPAGTSPPGLLGRWRKVLIAVGAATVGIAALAAAALYMYSPGDILRERLIAEVKARTGRDLLIAGGTSYKVYPAIGVALHDVSLSPPPGMPGAPLISMAELDVRVNAMPLFGREVEIQQLVMRRPVINLRIDTNGVRSWKFASAAPVRVAQANTETATDASAAPSDPSIAGNRLRGIKDVRLGDVRVEDGTIRYADERRSVTQDVTGINVKLALPSLDEPATAEGDLQLRGEKLEFEARLADVKSVIGEQASDLSFSAEGRHISAGFDGTVQIGDRADLAGKITATSLSARDLAAWLGTALPPSTGFGALSFRGTLRTSRVETALTEAAVSLDGANANGRITVRTGGMRPEVDADLRIDELDLNRYLADATAVPSTPDTIEKLLNAPGPKVKGFTARAGWSSAPINLALLAAIDGTAKLQVGTLKMAALKAGPAMLSASLKNRILKTQLDSVQMYDGRGRGFVTIDGSGEQPALSAAVSLENVSAQSLLADAADMTWLSGKSAMTIQVSARGTNELQMLEQLNGTATFAMTDGAVAGFDFNKALSGLAKGSLAGLKMSPAEKTDFNALTATFNIAAGIAQNTDLRLTSPALTASGAGTVNLPLRQLDYTLRPKLAAATATGDGQVVSQALSGLEIPVRISGPWEKPSIQPDIKGLDTTKALNAAKELGKQFKGRSAGEIADELFTKKPDGSSGIKDLFRKFKGGQ